MANRLKKIKPKVPMEGKERELLKVPTTDFGTADPYFGWEKSKPPDHVLKTEKPHHRLVIYLAAAGDTKREIKAKTGFSNHLITYVLAQEWAQAMVAKLQAKHGDKMIKNVLKGAAVDAANTMVDIMTGKIEAKAADRLKAANDIVNRLLGTAPQIVVTGSNTDPKTLEDSEIVKLLKEEKSGPA